jgi:AcrR family transcriptional regulator
MTEPRDRILGCACELYLEDGFEGFSMRKLARAVGVTAPALYRHYESKERVLLDVVGEAHKILAQYLYRSLAGTSPEDRFARAGKAYLDFALDHPRYFKMIFAFTDFMGLEEIPDEIGDHTCAIGQFWDDRVRECMEAGMLRRYAGEQIGLTLWAHAYGLISLYLRGMLQVPQAVFREMYRESFERILVGLAEEPFARKILVEGTAAPTAGAEALAGGNGAEDRDRDAAEAAVDGPGEDDPAESGRGTPAEEAPA